jgi:branched-chain amino acid transport system substrate-binding protein
MHVPYVYRHRVLCLRVLCLRLLGLRLLTAISALSVALIAPCASQAQTLEVVVAIPAPLTGRQASSGIAIQTMAGLIAAEINASGGINGAPLVLSLHDDPCLTGGFSKSIADIAASPAVAVIGHPCAPSARAAIPTYAAAGKVFIATGVDRRQGPRQNLEAFRFRIPVPRVSQATFIGQTLAAVPGARIAIVRDKTQLTTSLAADVTAALLAAGVTASTLEIFEGGSKDFAAMARRLATAKITHVALLAFAVEAGPIAAELVAASQDIDILGPDILASSEFPQLAGQAVARTRVVLEADVAALGRENSAAAALIARLTALGVKPTPAALATAAALQAWAAAARRAGTTQTTAVAKALAEATDTVLGPIAFDATGAAKADIWRWVRWRDGVLAPGP